MFIGGPETWTREHFPVIKKIYQEIEGDDSQVIEAWEDLESDSDATLGCPSPIVLTQEENDEVSGLEVSCTEVLLPTPLEKENGLAKVNMIGDQSQKENEKEEEDVGVPITKKPVQDKLISHLHDVY